MDNKCKGGGSIKEMYLIEWKDIKSFEPFELKRKYGKRKRIVYKIDLEDKSEQDFKITFDLTK